MLNSYTEIHRTRIRARRNREPPPTFEDALVNSRPVSHIDVEEPPPSYNEYLNATSPDKDAYLDYNPSVNPSDIVIPLVENPGSDTLLRVGESNRAFVGDSGTESHA